MADFSEKALENVKTKDLGSVGDMLTNVVTELKSFDAQEEEKGFFSFLKKISFLLFSSEKYSLSLSSSKSNSKYSL